MLCFNVNKEFQLEVTLSVVIHFRRPSWAFPLVTEMANTSSFSTVPLKNTQPIRFRRLETICELSQGLRKFLKEKTNKPKLKKKKPWSLPTFQENVMKEFLSNIPNTWRIVGGESEKRKSSRTSHFGTSFEKKLKFSSLRLYFRLETKSSFFYLWRAWANSKYLRCVDYSMPWYREIEVITSWQTTEVGRSDMVLWFGRKIKG